MNASFWKDKSVFLTGHTGFKGSWLTLWLNKMGAKVTGFSLAPPTEPSLFVEAKVQDALAKHIIGDIRDALELRQAMQQAEPDIVIHMAAQSLVRDSYQDPITTYATNVMGTVHLLEAIRKTVNVKAVLNITTDKCYENNEWLWGYRENDPMGGYDPYSSSKGCAELVSSAYRRSFLADAGVAMATARTGNVIGGGDWAQDRLIPDFFCAMDAGKTLSIRSPESIRPWQHVLEPLSGYLRLTESLYTHGESFAEGWNFGPSDEDAHSVRWIVERLAERRQDVKWQCDDSKQQHEAHYLKLDSSKARMRLNWQAKWRLQLALEKTLEWHQAWKTGNDMRTVSLEQISQYQNTSNNESI